MSKQGIAPLGPNRKGMSKIRHKSTDVWECRVCAYKPNIDKYHSQCLNCGRDFWGNPGTIPSDATRDGT